MSEIVSAFVLERQRHARAVGSDLSIFNCHVQFHDLGYPQIAQRAGGGLNGFSSFVRPRFRACANNLQTL